MFRVARVLEDRAVRKIGHDLKFDAIVLARHGVTLQGLDLDTMLASYLIDATRAGSRCPQKISGHRNRRNVSPTLRGVGPQLARGVPPRRARCGARSRTARARAAVHLWACPFGPIVQCSFSSP
jgi:hypothetical protein